MKLIINADDFGITKKVSEGIIQSLKNGIVTDMSALVNSERFIECAEMAKKAGIEAMGVHLTITFLRPILSGQLKDIVDSEGNFYKQKTSIPKPYNYVEIEKEFRAQIDRFLSTGLKISHFDTHHVISILDEKIYEMILNLCEEYGVPMRKEVVESADNEIINNLVKSTNVKMVDNVIIRGGIPYISESFLLEQIDEYKDKKDFILEIIGHPGILDDELIKVSSLTFQRERDLNCFNSVFVKKYIEDNNVELISYSDL